MGSARACSEAVGASAGSLIVLPGALLGQPVTSYSAEIQMLLGRIHPPLQHREEERRERGKRGKSREDRSELARKRELSCGRTRHLAQTRRTREFALFVSYAFTAECSSASRTPRGRLT